MKRKAETLDDEEARLSQLLFKKNNFTENLQLVDDNLLTINENPAWVDDDDDQFKANLLPNNKSKSLYKEVIKQKYETLIGTPNWAKLNKTVKVGDDDDDTILRTAGHLERQKSIGLKKKILEIKQLSKINSETGNEGPIVSNVEFHPKSSVVLVAGHSGVVSLFSIGGESITKLHSFLLKQWKICNSHFHPDGTCVFIASSKSDNYCVYDLVKAQSQFSEFPVKRLRPSIFHLSSDGKYLVVGDGTDEIYIICAQAKELLRTLKHNSNVVSVAFGPHSETLYTFTIEGQVTEWNMSTYRAVTKFQDDGCVNASCMSLSPCGRLIATGSAEGIVNVYETPVSNTLPSPLCTISNLRTKITSIKFNASSEILALASSYYPNALKLVHIPSYHVFSNFPIQNNNIHQIAALSFSPNSGYMSLGNNKNSAYLYRLKHFKNY